MQPSVFSTSFGFKHRVQHPTLVYSLLSSLHLAHSPILHPTSQVRTIYLDFYFCLKFYSDLLDFSPCLPRAGVCLAAHTHGLLYTALIQVLLWLVSLKKLFDMGLPILNSLVKPRVRLQCIPLAPVWHIGYFWDSWCWMTQLSETTFLRNSALHIKFQGLVHAPLLTKLAWAKIKPSYYLLLSSLGKDTF